jgi:DNA adenine methylase
VNSSNSVHPKPFLKWAGGKRAVLPEILPRIPEFEGTFIEPFLGAGAVLFSIPAETKKIANDFNSELIGVYKAVRDDLDRLVHELKKHKNTKEHFLKVRAMDRNPSFHKVDPVAKAARFIYLNKTCFNGLYRVNADGYFNVPFGNYARPEIVSPENLLKVSEFLSKKISGRSAVRFMVGDFAKTTALAKPGDFVYLDPPYDPTSGTSSFVNYQQQGFTKLDQQRLRDEMIRLTKIGVPVLLSNSDTSFIRSLYSDRSMFRIEKIQVRRTISASVTSRGSVGEVLVSNKPGA